MSGYEHHNDKTYRRGLILGLTMAEIMILLVFILLMILAAALANREQRLAILDKGGASRLVEALQHAHPQAKTPDDFYKELVRDIDARAQIESQVPEKDRKSLLADAELGKRLREAAASAGAKNPEEFANTAITNASRQNKKGEWPPFFSLSEAGGYYFESGKATLRPDFERQLIDTVIPLLRKNIDDYGVDVVEVIGHTDEVPMSGTSNLDKDLIAASQSRFPISSLRSTDNSGLAMARAVAVVKVLRADPRLNGITILPLSGAQMIVPVDKVADGSARGDDQSRRRIEIRLRRSSQQVASGMYATDR